MKLLLIVLGILMAATAGLGIPAMQLAMSRRAEVEASASAIRATDPSLKLYHDLTSLRTNMLPDWKATESWANHLNPKNPWPLDHQTFVELSTFHAQANDLQHRAQAEGINPDVRQAAEATCQELDELMQGITDAEVVQLSAGEFGKGLDSSQAIVALTGLNNVTSHMSAFGKLNTIALDALDAYAATYAADHGVAPA